MNRRTFLSIITFTLTFHKGGASLKTNDIEDNALRDGNTEVDAGGNRNNHVVEPIGKKYRHDSFYDFDKWGFDEVSCKMIAYSYCTTFPLDVTY